MIVMQDWFKIYILVSNIQTSCDHLSCIVVFPKWKGNSVNSANSGNLINHWSKIWAQFKDPVSHTCLAGVVVASWSLTQELVGSSPFNDKISLSLDLLNSVKTFRENPISSDLFSFCWVGIFKRTPSNELSKENYAVKNSVKNNSTNSSNQIIDNLHVNLIIQPEKC